MARKKTSTRPARGKLVSDSLRDAIAQRDLSDYQLGQLAEVDPGVIGRFMRRERDISGPTIDRLCSALGLALVEPARPRGRPTGSRDEPRSRPTLKGLDRSVFEVVVDDVEDGQAEPATGDDPGKSER